MAVVENARASAMTPSNRDALQNDVATDHSHHQQSTNTAANSQKSTTATDQSYHLIQQKLSIGHQLQQQHSAVGNGEKKDDDGGEGFKREMRDLAEMLSKLNPMAEEFVPPSLGSLFGGGNHGFMVAPAHAAAAAGHFGYNANGIFLQQLMNSGVPAENSFRRVSISSDNFLFSFS